MCVALRNIGESRARLARSTYESSVPSIITTAGHQSATPPRGAADAVTGTNALDRATWACVDYMKRCRSVCRRQRLVGDVRLDERILVLLGIAGRADGSGACQVVRLARCHVVQDVLRSVAVLTLEIRQ